MQKADRHHFTAFDPSAPERGQIPTLDFHPPFDADIEQPARDAILAYSIHSVLANLPGAMEELETALRNRFIGPFPGKSQFDDLHSGAKLQGESDMTAENIIGSIIRNDHLAPDRFWLAGLRLFEWIRQSRFRDILASKLAAWQRSGWTRILTNERFNLVRPMQTVPPIEDMLTISADDRSFIAKLLLATSDAVGSSLAAEYRITLVAIAENDEPVSSPTPNLLPNA